MDYHSNTANANMQIDNLYINDPSYVTPINVTATDVTVDKAQVVKDDVITITPTVPAGKKLSAVKVNGTAVTAVDGKYTYTVTGEESAIAVTADFVRADVDNVVVSSTNTDVQIGQKVHIKQQYMLTLIRRLILQKIQLLHGLLNLQQKV